MDLHTTKNGEDQTPELRITQATGALLLTALKPLNAILNERITTYIERSNGSEDNLATNILLKHAIIGAVYGEGDVRETTDVNTGDQISVLLELANGSIILGTDETIKCKLTDLDDDVKYSINTIQFPESATSAVLYDKLTILSDETTRSFDVTNKDLIIIEKFSLTRDTTITYSNGHRIKYTPSELKAISFDVEPSLGFNTTTGTSLSDIGDCAVIPLADVIEIEFQKIKGFQELTLITY